MGLLDLLPIFLNCSSEHWPFHAADKATLHPTFSCFWLYTFLLSLEDLFVKQSDDLLASIHPFVPIPPYERTGVSFFFKEINTVMQLAHSFRNLLGGFRNAQILRGESPSVEELFETTIAEGTKQSWANSLSSKTTKNCQLTLTVDEMLYLRPVDAKQKLCRGSPLHCRCC